MGVEDIERRHLPVDPRPYFLAHRELQKLPLIGEFRGFTRPELVLALPRQPQKLTQADLDRIAAAHAKRDRKAAKRRPKS